MTNELTQARLRGRGGGAVPQRGHRGEPAARAGARRHEKGRRVAVLGGGMAGLTVAHELAERGFKVDVYEPVALGGKARSIGVPGHRPGRARAAPRRARLPVLPGLLPPRSRLHAPDPVRQQPERRLGQPRRHQRGQVGARERPSRRPVPGDRSTTRRRRFSPRGASEHPRRGDREAEVAAAARGRLPGRAADGVLHELRRAPLRRVGERGVVGLHRRRGALRGVPARGRARAHALTGRRQGDRRRRPGRSATWPRRS